MSTPAWRATLVSWHEDRFGPTDRAGEAYGFWLFIVGVVLVVAGSVLAQNFGDAFALFLPLAYPSPFEDALPRLLQGWGYAAVLAGAVHRLPVGPWMRRLAVAALGVAVVSIAVGSDVTGNLPWRPLQWVYFGAVAVLLFAALAAPLSLPSTAGNATDRSGDHWWLAPATLRWLSIAGPVTVLVGLAVFLSAGPTSYEPLSYRLTLGIQVLQLGAGAFVAGVLVALPLRRWARGLALLGVGLSAVGVAVTASAYALFAVTSVRLPESLALSAGLSPFVGLAVVTLLTLLTPWLGDPDARRSPAAAEGP